MPSLTLVMVVVLLVILILPYNIVYGDEQQQETCSRTCGVHNITYPFRLNDSPENCGDKDYTLSCENNYRLILYYDIGKHHGKYYVQSINYNNFTIRLLDFNPGSNNSLPPYYNNLGLYNFSYFLNSSYIYCDFKDFTRTRHLLTKSILYVRCPNGVEHSSAGFMYGAECFNSSKNSFYVGGYRKSLLELGLRDDCRIESMYLTSWRIEDENKNISCTDIRHMLFYGFELTWIRICKHRWYVKFYYIYLTFCEGAYGNHWSWRAGEFMIICIYSLIIRCVLFMPCITVFLIIKWRRRHSSLYKGIEEFLSNNSSIMPIRYSYREIKKITNKFEIKLGKGGYGSVFKGQLRSGHLVAVKLLDNAKSNGLDFVNEVLTIGRIHHVNVVRLIGFCAKGSKRVLVYEFMPHRSLEKYIFSPNKESCSLSCETLYAISLGVARGIEYLHNGCNMKILHFDIKPHNILLDENFNPKVSDFGLARLCPTNKSIVSLTAARGTIGYMAPELFYRNVGTISYKVDVYSFGVLLMEMANRRKNLNALDEQSSQMYLLFWVYDQLHDGREITIEDDTIQEMKLAKKMMIVALWCIQTNPDDRPPIKKVIEMLEEEVGDLQMPNKPYLYAQDLPAKDIRDDIISNL